MQKSLYSLMLMDSVVREIDRLALQHNTNRSNMINQILAEYVSMMTPEKRIASIFKSIEDLMTACESEIVPHISPNQTTMSLRSSLEYKYRPTIRYEVALYRVPEGRTIGELNVIFRTQSQALINAMTEFFRLLSQLESKYKTGAGVKYALYDSRFTRSIQLPEGRDYTIDQLGDNISSYIRMLDSLLKSYVGGCGEYELERRYIDHLNRGIGKI